MAFSGSEPTEFDFSIVHNQIWRAWLIVHIQRFFEKLHKALRVHQTCIDRSVDIPQLIQRPIELNYVHGKMNQMI